MSTPHGQVTPDVDGGCLPLLATKVRVGSDSRGSEGPGAVRRANASWAFVLSRDGTRHGGDVGCRCRPRFLRQTELRSHISGRVGANALPGAWVTSEMNKTGHSPISITKVVGALATVGWVVVVVLVLWSAVGVGPRSGRSPIQVRCRYVRPRWGRRRPTLVRGVYSGLGMPNLGLGVADAVLVPLVALDATPHGPRSGLRGRCG